MASPLTHETSRSAAGPLRATLVLAIVAAALLRFWALPQGIPFNVGVDEPEIMERALRIIRTGDFNPHFFDYPSLYIYVQAAVAVARFIAGAMHAKWSSLAQASTPDFYLWGRAVTALLGTLTVWLTYRIGRRWNERTGVLAAVLLATMPLHVRESHYVLTDVPTTLFVTLALLQSLAAHARPRLLTFAAAGAMAGLAAATKYNGVLAIAMPLVACLMTKDLRLSRLNACLAVVAGCLAAFFVTAPYTLLDLPTFLNQFARLSSAYRNNPLGGERPWLTYAKHLRIALGWAGSTLAAGGFLLGVVRMWTDRDRMKWVLVVTFPVLYFYFIAHQNIIYARYLLPLLPFLALLAAATFTELLTALGRAEIPAAGRQVVVILLTLLVMVPSSIGAFEYDVDASRVWTNQQAYEWITAHVPKDARVTIESRGLLLPDYPVRHVKQLRLDPADAASDYLVASSQCYGPYFDNPKVFPNEYADYVRIFRQTQEIARFVPSPDHPGPELRVLKVVR